ncbi:MAG: choice-of-anchor D domain-containing protein, partial [Pirellulales bacterium]
MRLESLEARNYLFGEAVHGDHDEPHLEVLPPVYLDEPPPPAPAPVAGALLEVPVLQSNPSAAAKLYLDFDGHTQASWSDYTNLTTPAYDIDGDPTGFSAEELTRINRIWTRVAEDYAPFNLDVTTVQPPSFANGVAMRVAIGGSSADWYEPQGGSAAGGVAYIDTWTNNVPNLVYVFSSSLASGSERYVAEASSHEAGHGFGLKHQSSYDAQHLLVQEYYAGTGDWAPIMGLSYSAPLSTFHNGTSTAWNIFQDDLAVIGRPQNGFGVRTDDFGGTNAAATPLTQVGTTVNAGGIIERSNDVDVFSFHSGAGTITVSAAVSTFGPNLNTVLELRDAANTVITTADPTPGFGATINTAVAAGDYYLHVRGTGEYGRVGRYTISGNVLLEVPEIGIRGNGQSIVDGDITPKLGDFTSFGTLAVGTSLVRTYTIESLGSGPLTLSGPSSVTITGPDAAFFSVVAQPTSPIAPGGSTTFQVQFLPTATGVRDATVNIASDDANENPYEFAIRGNASSTVAEIDLRFGGVSIVDGDLTPAAADGTDFSAARTDGGTITRTFTIANTGTTGLNLTGAPLVSISGADAADFTVTALPTTPIAAVSGTTTFAVRFDPSADGLRTATISIVNSDTNESPYDFAVQGMGASPGVVISPGGVLTTTEAGGTASFSVSLTTQPSADVTIGVSSGDTTEGTVSVSSLLFTTADWNLPHNVLVTGVNDFTIDGAVGYSILLDEATSADPTYNGYDPADVDASNTDDDTAAITVSPTSGLITTEPGGTATFTMVLTSQPSANVAIGVTSSDSTEATVSPGTVTFTPGDWNVPKVVTVTGANDTLADGNISYSIVTAAATSSDANYSGINPANVTGVNQDNDQPTTVVPLRATSWQYFDDITRTANAYPDATQAPTRWHQRGYNTANPGFGAWTTGTAPFAYGTVDGFVAPITAIDMPWATKITALFRRTFALSAAGALAPTATIRALCDDGCIAYINGVEVLRQNIATGAVTPNTATLTFADEDTFVPTPIDLVALGVPLFADGSNVLAVEVHNTVNSSTDLGFDMSLEFGVGMPGIIVTPVSGLATSEAGGTAQFNVRLAAQPSANVSIGISSSDTSEGTVSTSSLLFTPGDWNVAQTVTVTGQNDALADGNISYTIVTAPAASADVDYNGRNAADVAVTNIDDEPVQELLPDLFAWASEPNGYIHGWYFDTAETPGRTLLRLSTATPNIGSGPVELRGGALLPGDRQEVYQRIYHADGGFHDRLAGTFVYHPAHDHTHFEGFAEYNLREVLPGNGVGPVVAAGGKTSFCLLDLRTYDLSLPGAPSTGQYSCSEELQGISVGYSDVYDSSLPDQWIDVTGVPSGQYWLEVTVDPLGQLSESNEANNTTTILIDLTPPGPTEPDAYEPNDSFAGAWVLPAGDQSLANLTLHVADNDDYYRWTAVEDGQLTVSAAFNNSAGDVELYLYSASQVELDSSTGTGNSELVTATVVAGQSYYIQVTGAGGDTSPDYDLTIDGPEPLGSIAGRAYNDLDGDGSPDAGEPGLSGRTVFLDQNGDGQLQ